MTNQAKPGIDTDVKAHNRREHLFIENIEKKWCSRCSQYKGLGEFCRDKSSWDYLSGRCKVCNRTIVKEWKAANPEGLRKQLQRWNKKYPEKRRAFTKQWHKANPERAREIYKQWHKRWRAANPERHREINQRSHRKRMSTPKGRLDKIVSDAVYRSLKAGKMGQSWTNLVGWTLPQLIRRLKRTLPAGYAWGDYVAGKTDLHIDHKIPISVFNFSSTDDPDFKHCWDLKNLQLLPGLENIQKGNKLAGPFQPSFSFVTG